MKMDMTSWTYSMVDTYIYLKTIGFGILVNCGVSASWNSGMKLKGFDGIKLDFEQKIIKTESWDFIFETNKMYSSRQMNGQI